MKWYTAKGSFRTLTRAIGNNPMRVKVLPSNINQETNEGKDKTAPNNGEKPASFPLRPMMSQWKHPDSIGYESGSQPGMWDHRLF